MSFPSMIRFLKPALLAASAISFAFAAQARADELVVSAAASLTNAFKAVGDAYEKEHPGT
jgi:molybdate transport system substrate-binding protein